MVVAFGRIIKPPVLAALPMVNLHFSLLPRWRGAAPVERAILAGDTVTGVCVMTVEEGLDTGPVHACETVDIGPDETADELRARLVVVGTELLVEQLGGGLSPPVPQEGEPTYAAKVEPDELHLDWSRPRGPAAPGGAPRTGVDDLAGQAAAGPAGPRRSDSRRRPAPRAALDGLVVTTGEGGLELVEVQPEGKQPDGRVRSGATGPGRRPANVSGRRRRRPTRRSRTGPARSAGPAGPWSRSTGAGRANVVLPDAARQPRAEPSGTGPSSPSWSTAPCRAAAGLRLAGRPPRPPAASTPTSGPRCGSATYQLGWSWAPPPTPRCRPRWPRCGAGPRAGQRRPPPGGRRPRPPVRSAGPTRPPSSSYPDWIVAPLTDRPGPPGRPRPPSGP